jgi:hypothetical protein
MYRICVRAWRQLNVWIRHAQQKRANVQGILDEVNSTEIPSMDGDE